MGEPYYTHESVTPMPISRWQLNTKKKPKGASAAEAARIAQGEKDIQDAADTVEILQALTELKYGKRN